MAYSYVMIIFNLSTPQPVRENSKPRYLTESCLSQFSMRFQTKNPLLLKFSVS